MTTLLAALLAVAAPAAAWPPQVIVDPRLELLAVVHALSGPGGGFAWDDTGYGRDAQAAFAPFAGHPSVAAYRKARAAGLNAVEAQRVAFRLGGLPKLKAPADAPPGEAPLLAALERFAADSRFAGFYEAHRPLYESYASEVSSRLALTDYQRMLEDYTGLRVSAGYVFVLSPLRGPDANFNDVQCVGGPQGHLVRSAIGASRVEGGRHVFDLSQRRWDVWHELGHTLLDAELDGRAEAVARTAFLAGPDPSACYGEWANCLREHAVQGLAFAVMQWARREGRAPEPVWTTEEKAKKLHYIDAVVERLGEFERRRKDYPTLREFYPRLLAVFLEKAAGRASGPAVPVPPAKSSCRAAPAVPVSRPAPPSPGLEKFARGDVEGAVAALRAEAARDPLEPAAHLNLAVALNAAGRLAEAVASADEAVRLALMGRETDPTPAADALSTRASLRRLQGSSRGEAEDLERALQVAPADWPRRPETAARLRAVK